MESAVRRLSTRDHVLHVVGARPNFPKFAPVYRALRAVGLAQSVVHTGQHYDALLSDVFWRDLELMKPDYSLEVGSASHAEQTASVMIGVERILIDGEFSAVLVYGDINSTLGAALAAAKIGTPVVHVEAGLRSFDDTMPEEINRRLTDSLSTVLFVTCDDGVANLEAEGLSMDRVHLVGNTMIDSLQRFLPSIMARGTQEVDTWGEQYAVVTVHRPSNVDSPAMRKRIVAALDSVADHLPLVVPLHPRSRTELMRDGLDRHPRIHVIDPMPYLNFLGLVARARVVITDSGGVQEETSVLGIPCLTVRPNTERPVTVRLGTNRLATWEDLNSMVRTTLQNPAPPATQIPLWDGQAGMRIAEVLTGVRVGTA